MPDDSANYSLTPPSPRRTFVARMAGFIAAWPVLGRVVVGRATAAMTDSIAPPNAALAALADAVLPSELGSSGVARATEDFQRWMDEYQPGAEANHGYGTGRIDRLPADPRPQWTAQLAALDNDARRVSGRTFATLSREQRQTLVRTALSGERGDALPSPLAARHVALALLAQFYDSPAALDLCYAARIGRQSCRPLAAQRQQPVAIGRRGR